MQDIIETCKNYVALYGLDVIAAIAILILGRIAAGVSRSITRHVMQKSKVDETLISFCTNLVYVSVLTFMAIAALGKIGVQTASFVAIIGAAGLAVGLALQGSLSNFASGVLLIIFRPIRTGDFVKAGGESGIVEEIGIFITVLRSPDNKTMIIPNSKLTGDNITNFTTKATRRVDLVVGVSYSENLDKVKNVLEDILNADARVLKDPAYTIGVLELADSSVNFAVRPWVKTADYWDVFFSINETVKKRFDAEGICIPFPQRDVHLHQ